MVLVFSTWKVALKDWYMGMALNCKLVVSQAYDLLVGRRDTFHRLCLLLYYLIFWFRYLYKYESSAV